MNVCYLDGPAKVGKTFVATEIRNSLEAEGLCVEVGVAGNFFRRITDEALRRAGVEVTADDAMLAKVVQDIIDEGVVYREDHPWGDLQAPIITDTVHHVGKLQSAQTANDGWFERRANAALDAEADVLIVDARNPRFRLCEWQRQTGTSVALDLFLSCSVNVAAKRALMGEGNQQPSIEEIAHKAGRLMERRAVDAQPGRPNAFIEPSKTISFVPCVDIAAVAVARSFLVPPSEDAPLPIAIDNTHIQKMELAQGAADLALAAMNVLLDH